MRARQLVASLRQGRAINIDVLDEGWFEHCYLAGWDDDTYFVLRPQDTQVEKYLIPKHNILAIQLMDERTFRDEALHPEMEKIIGPFRTTIDKSYPKN